MAYESLTKQHEFWNNKPSEMKEGDQLEGTVKLIQEARDPKSSRSAVLELSDGTTKAVWLSTVIDGAFKSGVSEGDKVRITYKGKSKTKNGTEFNDYEVEVDKD